MVLVVAVIAGDPNVLMAGRRWPDFYAGTRGRLFDDNDITRPLFDHYHTFAWLFDDNAPMLDRPLANDDWTMAMIIAATSQEGCQAQCASAKNHIRALHNLLPYVEDRCL